ncbi:hypothetical protein [Azospirillum ramasamyi]|uniref:Uncharacterized protein n=1 Tax=Azospirillum ramasamyi TaxID=682998 RepID=A0A2U9S240_9PROT|nr:hypothetical protein [Azospirillum ramasamyi]AWU93624.1 hypothetical protein DM194_04755 [Azospirillum ramasamyi]
MNKTFVFTAVGAVLLSTGAMAQVAGSATTPQAGSSYTMGSTAGTPPMTAPARGLPVTDTPQGGKVVVLGEGIGERQLAEQQRMEQMRSGGYSGSSTGTYGYDSTGSSYSRSGSQTDGNMSTRGMDGGAPYTPPTR